jgi:cytochrome c-type biogenesis protein CcsB
MTIEQTLFLAVAGSYLVSVFLNVRLAYALSGGAARAGRGAEIQDLILFAAVILHLAGLVLRTVLSGHAPFANTYESLVFFSWCLVLTWVLLSHKNRDRFVTAVVCLLAFLSLGVASVLPESARQVKPLVPALQSVWLYIHVITSFIGYAGFGVAFVASLLYLVRRGRPGNGMVPESSFSDGLSYRSVALGFTFLTLGILTGAIWAKHAWGRYWSWDPKETWALVTWLIYSFHLHSRLVRKASPLLCHWIAILGFIAVLFTYFGVNYLMTGLHSYR